MKRTGLLLLFFGLAAGLQPLSAQFSITKIAPKETETKALVDTTNKNLSITNPYFNQSREDAERRRIRKERNTVSFNSALQVTQTGFNENWSSASGGQNTFAGRGIVSFSHAYKKSKFNFVYDFEARYGLTHVENETYKNEDMFRLNINPSWDLNKHWSYAALLQFASQFSKGYKSRTEHILVSDFMSPGNLTLGLGFTYRHQKIPLTINISPLSGNMTFVKDSILRKTYSVDPNKTQKSSLGSSFILNMKAPLVKDKLTYTTYLDAFTNYNKVTRVRFDNGLDYTLFKFMALSFFCSTIYDHTINFADPEDLDAPFKRGMQVKYSAGLALTYTFKNK